MQKSKSARARSAPQILSIRQAAKRLGIDAGRLTKESHRAGFPWKKSGKTRGVLIDELVAWRRGHIRIRKPHAAAGEPPAPPLPPPRPDTFVTTPEPSLAAGEVPPASPAHSPTDNRFIAAMMSGEASAIDISRAAVQLASHQVPKSARKGELNPMELDSLKKTLQELRAAEADYIELAKSRRELIERAEVLTIVGMCCSRLVQVLSVLENSIATEFSLWLADPKIAEMPADDRARTVREFVVKTTREVRRLEADGVDALLEQSKLENDEGDDA